MKQRDQMRQDYERRSYTLSFPAGLSTDQVLAWVQSISGALRSAPRRLGGNPTLVFELWATDRGITHRLKAPWQHADYVMSQLLSLVPGIRYSPEDHPPSHDWKCIVEIGETDPSRSLRIRSPEYLSSSLLASVQALGEGEALLMQWVVTPAVPQRLPSEHKSFPASHWSYRLLTGEIAADQDEVKDRRAKLSEPNFLGVLRLAATVRLRLRRGQTTYSMAGFRQPWRVSGAQITGLRSAASLCTFQSACGTPVVRWSSRHSFQRRS